MSSAFSTALLILFCLCALLPSPAGAQDQSTDQPCASAKGRIYQITATKAQHAADSLQTLLNLASSVRDCQVQASADSSISRNLELWLLNNEVFALDGLERYEEASLLVDRFFERYADDASEYYLARFYLWRVHFSILSGRVLDVVAHYAEANKYAHALDPINRAHLYLNGAYAYLKIDALETALKLNEHAQDLLGIPETHEERTASARGHLLAAEAELRLRRRLDRVEEKLVATAGLHAALGDTSRVAIATTLLGMTHAAAGDTITALAELDAGTRLAATSGNARSQAFTLYRQGQLLRQWGTFDVAEDALVQALAIAETIVPEFFLEVNYELARLYEERRQYKRATYFFQTVVDAPPPEFADAKRAYEKSQEGLARMLRILEQRRRTRTMVAVLAVVLLVGIVGFILFRRRRAAPTSDGVFVPNRLHTGETLASLVRRFEKAVEPDLLASRLAYLFAVLFDPELVLVHVTNPDLVRQVETDTLKDNSALFLCVAMIEAAVTGAPLGDNPVSTIRAYLWTHFDKQGWPRPLHPLAWKMHFLQHHDNVLPRSAT